MLAAIEHVAMTLVPGRVVDFGDDGMQLFAIGLEAIIEGHRIEAVAEVAQVGQHADGAVRRGAGFLLHQSNYGLLQRAGRVAQIIFAPEPGQIAFAARPETGVLKKLRQFIQIEVHHEAAIAERMRQRQKAAVAHAAGVDGAVRRQLVRSNSGQRRVMHRQPCAAVPARSVR